MTQEKTQTEDETKTKTTESLSENKNVKRRPKGRPARFPNGSCVLRVPTDLKDDIGTLINMIYTADGINMEELNRYREFLRKG